jgi:hypothetical protein
MVFDLIDELTLEYDKLEELEDALARVAAIDPDASKHVEQLKSKQDDVLHKLHLLNRAKKKFGRESFSRKTDTFSGLIDSYIDDPTLLEKEGRDIELVRLAADRATERLYEYHEYGDGSVDIPILNWESYERAKTKETTDQQSDTESV